jgi:hypothetical protein
MKGDDFWRVEIVSIPIMLIIIESRLLGSVIVFPIINFSIYYQSLATNIGGIATID